MYELNEHIRERCQQRGIKERDIELIARFGTTTSKGLILTRKDIAEVEHETKRLLSRLSRLQDVFVATDGKTMKTAYRATRRQRRVQVDHW